MEQCHFTGTYRKQDSSDATTFEPAANFPQVRLKLAYQRHAQRPAKLHQLDVLTNDLPIISGEAFEPFTYRLAP